MNTCKNCQKSLTPFNKFCSKSCAAIFNNKHKKPRTEESKLKTSITLKEGMANGSIPKPPISKKKYLFPYTKLHGTYNCHHCTKTFWRTQYEQKTCSISCRDHICSVNKCAKVRIAFNNVFDNEEIVLQSSWELKIAEWLTQHNIIWSRPKKRIIWFDTTLQKKRTYLPDFYLKDSKMFLDVKNPIKMKEDEDKLTQLKKIIPLFVGNIEQIKEYVVHQTGVEPA